MSNEQETTTWLTRIGKLRDGLLVFGGATYVLGYLVWSLNAKRENLGLLPALEPQYLAAGIVPMLLLLLALYGFRYARKVPEIVTKWRDERQLISARACAVAGSACFVGAFGLWLWMKARSATFLTFPVPAVLSLAGMILALFGYPSSELREQARQSRKSLLSATMLAYLIVYLIAFVSVYLQVLYPILPQEFGGVRPRCAYLDVAKDQVSEATLKDILPSGAPTSTVVQSVRMQVYFSGSEFMLVRPGESQNSKANQPKPKLFELRKDVIKAVNWCE